MNDFVVVAIFNNQKETMKLRSVLERKKIPYIIQDETVVSVDPLQSIGFGNITLKVEEKDVDKVKKILIDLKKETIFQNLRYQKNTIKVDFSQALNMPKKHLENRKS